MTQGKRVKGSKELTRNSDYGGRREKEIHVMLTRRDRSERHRMTLRAKSEGDCNIEITATEHIERHRERDVHACWWICLHNGILVIVLKLCDKTTHLFGLSSRRCFRGSLVWACC